MDEQTHNLISAAIDTAQHAYIPYSNYRVGAALLATDGTIFTGCNVENAAYPATICAERTALVKAVSTGHREFDSIVVVSANGGFPCGTCRQMMAEFSLQMRVIIADLNGDIMDDCTLADLLPNAFTPAKLGQ